MMRVKFMLYEGPSGSVDQACLGILLSRLDPLRADGIFVISGSGRCDKPSNLHLLKVRVEVMAF